MSARADLCGGRSAMIVPTATSDSRAMSYWVAFDSVHRKGRLGHPECSELPTL